jgi:hypothetical protein
LNWYIKTIVELEEHEIDLIIMAMEEYAKQCQKKVGREEAVTASRSDGRTDGN